MMAEYLTPIANHLWQSTLCVGVAALLALALRRNRASVRCWVWITASVKFLVPFSLLTGIGAYLEWPAAAPIDPRPVASVVQDFSYPFAVADAPSAATALLPAPPASASFVLPLLLGAVWLGGSLLVALSWLREWRRVRSMVSRASKLSLDIPIAALSCPGRIEPGVVGVLRPVLLLPDGITERLTPMQLRAILVHELCHVRRRDNLTAAVHMVVEMLFWFYPLVWWIERRLIAERERACDEEVLRVVGEPQAYAEGILSVCRLYTEAPLACVSGVSGASLTRRIEDIMRNHVAHELSAGGRVLLAVVAGAIVAAPIAIGVVNATDRSSDVALQPSFDRIEASPARPPAATAMQTGQAVQPVQGAPDAAPTQNQTPADAAQDAFEVASVRPTRFQPGGERGAGGGGRSSVRPAGEPCGDHPNSFFLKFDPSRAMVSDMTLYGLITWAYDLSCRPLVGAYLLDGGPGWVRSDGYDIEALIPPGPPAFATTQIDIGGGKTATQQAMTPRFRKMLQTLLADRFKLVIRRESKNVPVYTLTVAPGGSKLAAWKEGDPTTVNELYDRLARNGTLLTEEQMAALGLTAAQVLELHNSRQLERRLYEASRGTGVSTADLAGAKSTMTKLVELVNRTIDPSIHRPILDRTGVTGEFNYRVRFNRAAVGPGDPGVSVFTALEQQLGLRLEPSTTPMQVYVIERAERPTAN